MTVVRTVEHVLCGSCCCWCGGSSRARCCRAGRRCRRRRCRSRSPASPVSSPHGNLRHIREPVAFMTNGSGPLPQQLGITWGQDGRSLLRPRFWWKLSQEHGLLFQSLKKLAPQPRRRGGAMQASTAASGHDVLPLGTTSCHFQPPTTSYSSRLGKRSQLKLAEIRQRFRKSRALETPKPSKSESDSRMCVNEVPELPCCPVRNPVKHMKLRLRQKKRKGPRQSSLYALAALVIPLVPLLVLFDVSKDSWEPLAVLVAKHSKTSTGRTERL